MLRPQARQSVKKSDQTVAGGPRELPPMRSTNRAVSTSGVLFQANPHKGGSDHGFAANTACDANALYAEDADGTMSSPP